MSQQHNQPNAHHEAEGRHDDVRAQIAQELSTRVVTNDDGGLDLMASIGGVRGLIEAIGPTLVFLVVFIATQDVWAASIGAVGLALVLCIIRLAQRQPLMQSLTGLFGVVLCAAVALFSNEARQYYVIGFYTNIAYGLAMIVSMLVRWPIMGLIYGWLRGEGIEWRRQPVRLKKYQLATLFIVVLFVARLAVQLPLYFNEEVVALGAARLAMGVPLYAMALWLAWLVSAERKPSERTSGEQDSAKQQPTD